LYTPYNYELGVDLREQMTLCDAGDVFTIPANLEKSFDQITRGVAHVASSGALPIMLGGDHSIGFPCVRGIAQCTSKRIGIIHFDRHIDIQEKDLDERMHTTPWYWATNGPHDHSHDHPHPHARSHDHPHPHARPGHNGARDAAQWQTPHLPAGHVHDPITPHERDLDLVEASFVEGFTRCSDATSFLRLAGIPFVGIAVDGGRPNLLRVEIEDLTDVGSAVPLLGGEGMRYDPLPEKLVSRRRHLSFVYHDGAQVVRLAFAEARALAAL
jgi:hypothetical protein